MQAVQQAHRTLMLDHEPVGDIADRRRVPVRRRMDDQQRLVLLRFHSGSTRHIFAEPQETPDAESELLQLLVFGLGQFPCRPLHSNYIVIRYISAASTAIYLVSSPEKHFSSRAVSGTSVSKEACTRRMFLTGRAASASCRHWNQLLFGTVVLLGVPSSQGQNFSCLKT